MRLAPLKRFFRPPFAGWLAGGCLLVTTGLLAGCKRLDGDTLCEGTVVDRHDNTRIANATVGVYEGGGRSGGYRLKETHQADASGNFAFQVNDDSEWLILRAFTDLGHVTSSQEALSLRGGKNNKKLVLKAQAPAWVRVNIIDQAPRDSVQIRFYGLANSIGFWINGGDTTVVLPVQGNSTTPVHWEITGFSRNPVTGRQDVYCPGLDTTSIQLTY